MEAERKPGLQGPEGVWRQEPPPCPALQNRLPGGGLALVRRLPRRPGVGFCGWRPQGLQRFRATNSPQSWLATTPRRTDGSCGPRWHGARGNTFALRPAAAERNPARPPRPGWGRPGARRPRRRRTRVGTRVRAGPAPRRPAPAARPPARPRAAASSLPIGRAPSPDALLFPVCWENGEKKSRIERLSAPARRPRPPPGEPALRRARPGSERAGRSEPREAAAPARPAAGPGARAGGGGGSPTPTPRSAACRRSLPSRPRPRPRDRAGVSRR